MPSRRVVVRHTFTGGFATAFGDAAEVGLGPTGLIPVPFFTALENCTLDQDGGPKKVGGTTKTNSVAIGSGEQVVGLFDFWRTSGASSAQMVMAHAGTVLYRSDDGGVTWTSILTGLVDAAVPAYEIFDDKLIVTNDNNSDVPRTFDQSSITVLGTNTPTFSFSETHKNRLWAAGVQGNESRLYYGPDLANSGPDGDWTANGGDIEIDPGDGDVITGLASHRNNLWVFKGPYKGSIHRIAGSSPTGSDGFARTNFVRGLGCVGHNTIFRFRNDLGFMWSDGSIHSLEATAAFGDFLQSSLSRDIHEYIQDHFNFNKLKYVTTAVDEVRGAVIIAVPIDSSAFSNQMLSMDYRFNPVRWSTIPMLGVNNACASIANYIDTADQDRNIVLAGGEDGFVRKTQRTNLAFDGATSYNAKATLPHLNYGDPFTLKTIYAASVGLKVESGGNVTFSWQGDNQAKQSQTVTQGTGARIGSFKIGTDKLAGSSYVNRYLELNTGGEFRQVQYEVTNGAAGEDLRFNTIGAALRFGPRSMENT